MLLDVWGWFIITTAAGIAAAAKNFAVQALHGNSPRSNIKIPGCQKCFVNSISMSHYAVTKSKSQAKNTYSMKSLKSPCSSQNPMGRWPSMTMLKVWHWRSNISPDSSGLFHTKIDCARQGPRWTLLQTQHGSLTYIGAPFGAAHGLPPGLHILHTDMATDKQGNDWYKLCCKKIKH